MRRKEFSTRVRIEDQRRDYGPEGCAERGVFFLLVVVAAVVALLLSGCDKPATGTPSPAPVASCEEDQPCWDCHTMGNKVCGPEDVRR